MDKVAELMLNVMVFAAAFRASRALRLRTLP